MPSAESAVQHVRQHLERILESSGFVRNERMSRFLRFVVERHLEGKDQELKETVIAIEVFGRRPDFDPRQDPVVRTEAGRLRARLSEYYINGGKADTVVIELPKGGYVPRFREFQKYSQITSPLPMLLRYRAWLVGGLLSLVAAVAAIGWWWTGRRSAPITIAVLPLENISHDPANEYFADGLTDEFIRNLSIIDGLTVRSRTSSFALKGKAANIRDAGQQLHADYILEGSVLRAGQQLRIEVQFVRASDDFPLWSKKFDRELTGVFAIQDRISREIVNNLRLALGHGRRRYETSVEAYDLYLHARAMPNQRGRPLALEAADIYHQVIAKDPLFAPAYAGLAGAYAASSAQGFRDEGYEHAEELTEMRMAAEKAIRLDPLLAEAYDGLGMVYARDGQWAQSEKSFRRAIELEPNNSGTYTDYSSWLLQPLGRIEEAVQQMRVAVNADPLSPFIQQRLGYMLISAGRYKEAASYCADSPECLGRALLGQGRVNDAIQILSTFKNPRFLGYAYGRAGRRKDAEKLAADVAPNAASQALIYAGLGDKDRTLEALDRVAELGAVRIGRALNTPEFALLRGDRRVKTLRQKVALPQ